jgi:hypothetical protein
MVSGLDMRPACERCGAGLPDDAVAFICSYECTFCQACADEMHMDCPNCGGELSRRPRRTAAGFCPSLEAEGARTNFR